VSNLNAVRTACGPRTILRERIRASAVGGGRELLATDVPEFPAPANRAVLVERGSCEDRGDAALGRVSAA